MVGLSGVSNQSQCCRDLDFSNEGLKYNGKVFDPQLNKASITQHVVYITCEQGEQKSLLASLSEKTVNFIKRTFIGALTSGAVMGACKIASDYGMQAGVFVLNPVIEDILVASAGLGVVAALATDSAGDAALRGIQFGGVASAAYTLTEGKVGALSQKFYQNLPAVNITSTEMLNWASSKLNEKVIAPICALLEMGPEIIHCKERVVFASL